MANPTQHGVLQRDDNGYPVMGGTSSADNSTVLNSAIDPITRRLLTSATSSGGTVTSVSVVTANGFAGTVATATTTPAITLTTTVTGILKGNGTAISAAVSNTDYQAVIALTTTGTSGASTFNGTTLNIPQYQAAGTYVTSVSGTSNRITSSGGTTPVIDIAATYVGQTSITTLGTVATGTWNGTVIGPAYGGTGVANNVAMTVTGSGNFAYTRTLTGTTNVTFPTTGTLATLAGTETLSNKIISLTVEPAVDDTYTGPSLTGLNAGATIAQWDLVILNSSSAWVLTDANTSSIYAGMVGIATTSGTNGNPLTVAVNGAVIRNDGWTWTPGATLYMSETAGAITATQPTTTDAAIRVVGFALTDDCIYFNASPDYITHT